MRALVMMRWKLGAIILTASLCALAGCKEQDKVVAGDELASFDLIQDRIFTPTCATAGCHASEHDNNFKEHGLVLAKGKSYVNLINILSRQPDAKAENLRRVKPYNSNESLLYHKLNWDATHHSGKQYGLPMPLGGNPLSVGQIEFVRRWIEAGAPDKGSVVDTTLLNDKTPSYVAIFDGLKPPAVGEGFQMKLGPFTVSPNFEREMFSRQIVGNNVDQYVNRVQVLMRPGSHHFILYDFNNKSALPPLNTVRDIRNPDGTTNFATLLSMQNHVFWAGTQTQVHDYYLPEGTALLLPAGASFDMNSHYVNKTAQPETGEVHVNLYTLPENQVKHVVQALNLGNESFTLPPGKTTVATKTFTFKKPTTVLMLTSHTHKLGEKFIIRIKGGTRDGEVVYESTDWEHPLIKNFPVPIQLLAGQGLTSEITYTNNTSKTIRFGLLSEDEMGIIFGYFYE
ncbi:hypothetical protein [Persicitalea jodogahamensis]|uniref:Copper type II ascorbate-dependent monooxygenase C-terminal domain-containing protein n=1 Tax=Persicitalea jodogahamensis TaxID=402147 RepID=A0A8J3D352_9BACT|nr:hypothetical protein [Persicitalea jodogahamensis]GHB65080.1 hypothetical protein GCM10007390_18970 [Persicitalea jodogahamensis]